MTDFSDTRAQRAAALEAAVQSLTRGHGADYVGDPSMSDIKERTETFADFIKTGTWPRGL
jgi:hypothetical protein